MTEKKATPRCDKPLCLIKMASMILSIVRAKETTTFSEVADDIINSLGVEVADANNERTLRRRVYDVLNVFVAAGFIAKDNKKIMYTHPPELETCVIPTPDMFDKVQAKKTALADKVKMFILWRLLIERNKGREKPSGAVPIDKTLFVGFRNYDQGKYRRLFDGRQLEIKAESPPLFFSPMNVVEALAFPREEQCRLLCAHEELRPLAKTLYPEFVTE